MNYKKNEPEIIFVENSRDFMGIKIIKNKVEIYVPAVYRKNSDSRKCRRELLVFLKSISLAKTIKNENIESSNKKFAGEMWQIDSYLWIIKDYLENGYFYNHEKRYSNDSSGKIDWKKTLKTIPVYSNGNVIYNKLVTSKISASNDLVAQIYKICLSVSLKRIGWVFNYNFGIDVQQVISIKEMTYIIQKEKEMTFDDVKRVRFNHMLKILKDIKSNNVLSNRTTYGITNYYYVVECMIDKMFKGIDGEQLKKYYPNGYWDLGNEPIETSMLRPDTIHIRHDNNLNIEKLYIIDSKMYKYGFTSNPKNLPQTASLLKQITYGDFIKNEIKFNGKIRNAFIIPYNKKLEQFRKIKKTKNLEYIGKAYGNWKSNDEPGELEDHDYIFAFIIDFNHLLNNYNKAGFLEINQLCNLIEDML